MSFESDDNDRELFRQFVGKVRRLNTDTAELSRNNKPKPVRRHPVNSTEQPEAHHQPPEVDDLSVTDAMAYVAPGLQKNILRRLRRGRYRPEAQLDLHGSNSMEAKRQLSIFLHQCSVRKLMCVRVIHGKGYGSSKLKPVLKNKVNVWLRQLPEVLAFASTTPADGGTGAVYVLIKSA